MNRLLKKSFALLLAACLLLALAVPALAGLDGNYTSPVPTVYLQGQGSTLYADKNNTRSGYIHDVAKSLIGPLAKGVLLNHWDEWVDTFVEGVAPLLEKQALRIKK